MSDDEGVPHAIAAGPQYEDPETHKERDHHRGIQEGAQKDLAKPATKRRRTGY
jgi:hypothetical protein